MKFGSSMEKSAGTAANYPFWGFGQSAFVDIINGWIDRWV
jgi:hypothetical protein